jgi:hypothetical protein
MIAPWNKLSPGAGTRRMVPLTDQLSTLPVYRYTRSQFEIGLTTEF